MRIAQDPGAVNPLSVSSIHSSLLDDSEYMLEAREVPKELPDNEKEFACLNNVNLEKFEYGEHMDNALTYTIRKNRFDLFKYLLKRGVSLLAANEDNLNAVHGIMLHN